MMFGAGTESSAEIHTTERPATVSWWRGRLDTERLSARRLKLAIAFLVQVHIRICFIAV